MKHFDPERWKKIEALLDELLELDPQERDARLNEVCADDEALKKEVRQLLHAGDDADDFLESGGRTQLQDALRSMAAEVDEDDPEKDLPRLVGPYRLVKLIGRGGMGQVFLAVRDDEPFTRYVAVKIIRRGMDTEDILKRFRTERRILSSLNHPHIARLFDGGITDDGLSYFVMEYVEGKPITQYCDEHALALEDRLELFSNVCSAVHNAHQNLIVHRDLKPSNILVTEEGDVKLLDFGIAKFLDADLVDYTLPLTAAEARVMTPEYASPEQIRGGAVTTASDVYQLGILLYELLTGHRPFTFETKARGEIEKIVLEKEPDKPSTAISKVEANTPGETALSPEIVSRSRSTPLERLRKQLSGDLDWIVLMALRKETERRYQSADQLLEDIRRYRHALPVSAQADTFLYRADRFIKRHRAGVIGGTVVALALIVATVTAVRSAVVTSRQRDRIQIEAQKTKQVKDFVLGLFEVANPELSRGREVSARDLLDEGAASVEQDLDDQPEIQSEMMHTIGIVYTDLGYFEQARPLLEKALSMRRETAGGRDTPELAQSLFDWAYLLDESGQYEEAVSFYNQALEMQIRLFGPNDLAVAKTQNDLAEALYNRDNPEEVLPYLEEALRTRTEILGDRSVETAEVLSNLAVIYHDMHDLDQAEIYYRRALDMIRDLEGPDHPIVASNLYNLGTLKSDQGKYEEAQQFLQEALEIRLQLYDEKNPYVARTINWLGRVAMARGNLEEAETRLQKSLDLHRQIYGDVDFYVGMDTRILAELAARRQQPARAESLYAASADILEEAIGLSDAETLRSLIGVGSTRVGEGKWNGAQAPLERILDIVAQNPDILKPPEIANVKKILGIALLRSGQPAIARPLLTASLGYYETSEPENTGVLTEIRALLVEAGE